MKINKKLVLVCAVIPLLTIEAKGLMIDKNTCLLFPRLGCSVDTEKCIEVCPKLDYESKPDKDVCEFKPYLDECLKLTPIITDPIIKKCLQHPEECVLAR